MGKNRWFKTSIVISFNSVPMSDTETLQEFLDSQEVTNVIEELESNDYTVEDVFGEEIER